MQDYVHRWTQVSVRNVIQHARTLNSCRDKRRKLVSTSDVFKCCISTTSECQECLPEKKLNMCEICHLRSGAQRDDPSLCVFSDSQSSVYTVNKSYESIFIFPANSCRNSINSYDVSSRTSVCCKCCQKNISFTDFLQPPFTTGSVHHPTSRGEGTRRRPSDRYVTDSLERLPRQLCSRLTFQKSLDAFPSAIIPDFASSSLPSDFTGRGCESNRTLSFIILDSQTHWMFAESLGLDVSQAHLSPVVVAFDKEREEHLVMKEIFSKKATASFILNFTRGLLERELRSVFSSKQEGCGVGSSSLCVTELTTDTFEEYINQSKDVVLMVYAVWCGFCGAISHTFLHLAHYFHTSPNITFARINGDTNDLAWEFSMDSYPTVIFFPSNRKADSVAFPEDVELTLPHLVRFVLQHATLATRLHLATDVCMTTCILENLDLARLTLRALCTKLRRLKLQLTALHLDDGRHQSPATSTLFVNVPSTSGLHFSASPSSLSCSKSTPSPYHIAVEKILSGRIEEIQKEIRDLKTLREFLLRVHEEGGHLDHRLLEELLYKKMRWK